MRANEIHPLFAQKIHRCTQTDSFRDWGGARLKLPRELIPRGFFIRDLAHHLSAKHHWLERA